MRLLMFFMLLVLVSNFIKDKIQQKKDVNVRKTLILFFTGFAMCSIQMRVMIRSRAGFRLKFMIKFIKLSFLRLKHIVVKNYLICVRTCLAGVSTSKAEVRTYNAQVRTSKAVVRTCIAQVRTSKVDSRTSLNFVRMYRTLVRTCRIAVRRCRAKVRRLRTWCRMQLTCVRMQSTGYKTLLAVFRNWLDELNMQKALRQSQRTIVFNINKIQKAAYIHSLYI